MIYQAWFLRGFAKLLKMDDEDQRLTAYQLVLNEFQGRMAKVWPCFLAPTVFTGFAGLIYLLWVLVSHLVGWQSGSQRVM